MKKGKDMTDNRRVVKITVLTHERAETVLGVLDNAGFGIPPRLKERGFERKHESKYGPLGEFVLNGMEAYSGLWEVASVEGAFAVNEDSVPKILTALSDAEEEGLIDFSFNTWVGSEAEYASLKNGNGKARGKDKA